MKFKTRDGTHLFYEDTGTGKPLVLIHGWPLSSAMWEYQLNELPERGIRCIAYDRRGFGKSDHPAVGFDYDTLASDLNDLLEHLDLHDVTLAGFSMGGGEVVRYLSTYGSDRVTRIALIAAVTPFMLKTSDNPDGVDKSVFDDIEAGLRVDRPNFLTDFTKTFFGFGWISSPISDAMLASNVELAMHASSRATLGCAKAFSQTDFRNDLKAISVPALIIHGDADKTVPFEASGQRTAKAIAGSKLVVYSGAPHGLHYTERARLNADLESWVAAGVSGVRSAAE
ncbi:MAG: alpha/beta hydrolase [Hyphomicrobiaceae bacterium]|nr:alpha/beta hydrolase [Hyphomicrobiaceae bacterium]